MGEEAAAAPRFVKAPIFCSSIESLFEREGGRLVSGACACACGGALTHSLTHSLTHTHTHTLIPVT